MKKSKKNFVFLATILVVVIFTITFFIFKIIYAPNSNKIELSKNVIDNTYNNYKLNYCDLLQIKNELYYNYNAQNSLTYGVYEISSKGSRRVYWEGLDLYPSVNSIIKYKNDILFDIPLNFNSEDKHIREQNLYKISLKI